MGSKIRDLNQLARFERINARPFPQGELKTLAQGSEATVGADRTSVLAGQERETCSIYPYRRHGRETDRTDTRAVSPIGKQNRQDSTQTTHRFVISDRSLQPPAGGEDLR